MKILLSLSLVASLFISASAFAEDAPARLLTCHNSKGRIQIGICGINGCPAEVTSANKTTKYKLSRKRNSDGSLDYTPFKNKNPRCSISIGALSKGARKVTKASCAKPLVGSNCQIG